MDNIQKLKLSNEVSMKVLKNDFPINGLTTIKINMVNNQVDSIEVRNTNKRTIKEG